MTWYLDPDTGDVIEDNPEVSSPQTHATLSEPYHTSDDVLAVMQDVWETEANLGNSPVMSVRAGYILMDMIQENIERGTP